MHTSRGPGSLGSLRALAVATAAAVWLAAIAIPPLLLYRYREARLAELDEPTVQAGWDTFRDEMRLQSGREGPVQRKVPRSVEPPERVWLRDYPALAATAWVVFAGVLGGVLALMAWGACSRPRGP